MCKWPRAWAAGGLIVLLALWLTAGAGSAVQAAPVLVIGTSQEEDTYAGRMQRRIYPEAFKRLGLSVQIAVYPLQRLSVLVDQGAIDGDVARAPGYGAAHPDQVRVEEPLYEVTWALFAIDPNLQLSSLAALSATNWSVGHMRGVGICENALKAQISSDRMIDVTSDAQAFSMMRRGRIQAHCAADLAALTLQYSPEFRDINITRRLADVGSFLVYPYLHKRHADLAPRLAVALKQMRAEGLMDRYRAEVLRELERR